MSKSEAGKGDTPRPFSVPRKVYEENFDAWLKKVKEARKKDENNK